MLEWITNTINSLGSVLGALPWYYVGKYLGEERLKRLANRYGKWLRVSAKDERFSRSDTKSPTNGLRPRLRVHDSAQREYS